MTISFFLQIWLEMPIHAPKIMVCGSEPLNVIGHHRDPQKAHHWPEPHLHANYFGTNRSINWCDLCVRRKNQKRKKKARKETCSGKLGRPPTLTQRYMVLHAGWSSEGIVISFKFRQNRLNGSRDVGVEICHFLYLRPVTYITACTGPTTENASTIEQRSLHQWRSDRGADGAVAPSGTC